MNKQEPGSYVSMIEALDLLAKDLRRRGDHWGHGVAREAIAELNRAERDLMKAQHKVKLQQTTIFYTEIGFYLFLAIVLGMGAGWLYLEKLI